MSSCLLLSGISNYFQFSIIVQRQDPQECAAYFLFAVIFSQSQRPRKKNFLLLREKYQNTEFFLVLIFPYSDQKKLRIWTLFTWCTSHTNWDFIRKHLQPLFMETGMKSQSFLEKVHNATLLGVSYFNYRQISN